MTALAARAILLASCRADAPPEDFGSVCASMPKCVLLAERHHRLSEGVRGLLETVFNGVFMVADQGSLMEGAERLSPALVIVDVSLAQGDMRDLLHSIHDRSPVTKVLLLSGHDEPTVVDAALAAGADGLVLTRAIATDLLPAVDEILAGRVYVSPTASRAVSADQVGRGE